MKRNLPGAVWEKIQPLIDQYRHLIIPVISDKNALLLKDSEPGSDFYFQCDRISASANYVVEQKPFSINSVETRKETATLEELVIYLTRWLEALNFYDTFQTVYDDPILKSYEAEFASSFAMQDEDADKKPFDLGKQLYLDKYLTNIKGLLGAHKEAATPEQKVEIESIIEDCASLQGDMTQLTKNQTIGRVAKIWAKARKLSLTLIKELMAEFRKEGYKAIIKATLEDGPAMAQDIWETIGTALT